MHVVRIVFTFIVAAVMVSVGAEKPETPHLEFVTEYVHELAAIENIRASAERDRKPDAKEYELFSHAIHTSTLVQLELRSRIRMLRTMRLNAPLDWIIPNLTRAYEEKIALYQMLVDISSAFIASPEPGVDYGKLAAEMPKITARLEYIDQGLPKLTIAICMSLIDMERSDSKNHVSHLAVYSNKDLKRSNKILNQEALACGKAW